MKLTTHPIEPDQSIGSIQKEILAVAEILADEQGSMQSPEMDPLDCLIETILSQNTNDINRDKAFVALKNHFSSWDLLLESNSGEIVRFIRVAGLGNQKADTILRTMRWLKRNFGVLHLDWLHDLKTDDIYNFFLPIKGIGIKTISIVCCFGLGRDVFPVDTHVNRLCQRLGWVEMKSSANHTFYKMAKIMPPKIAPVFHIRLIEHGREICTARNPKCDSCSLFSICKYPVHGAS